MLPDKIIFGLFLILHTIASIFEWFYHNLYAPVRRKIQSFRDEMVGKENLHEFLKEGRKPVHITILLNGEEPLYKDLAKIILWCFQFRIPYVSFYDCSGALSKNQMLFEEEVRKNSKNLPIVWHKGKVAPKNGFSNFVLHVKVFSEEDGKQSVVNLCRKLAKNGQTKDLTINDVDKYLHEDFEFPEPDLGLYCGQVTFKLHNYPPWHIRLTEFLPIETVQNITFSVFQECLKRFSKCQQRVGK